MTLQRLGKTVLEIRDFDSPTLWANDHIFLGLRLTFRNLAFRFGSLTLQRRFGKTVLEIRDFDSPTLWANDDIFLGFLLTFRNLALRSLTLQLFGKTVLEIRDCDSPTPRENGVSRNPFGSSCRFGSKSSIRLTKRVPRVLG